MSTPAGQSGVMLTVQHRPEPNDRGWTAFSAKLAPAKVVSPQCSRDGSTWTVRIQRLGDVEKTFSAESMKELIALVSADWGIQ